MRLTYEDGGEGLIYPDGTVLKGEDVEGLLLKKAVDHSEDEAMLILENKDFTLEAKEGRTSVPDSDSMPLLVAVYMNNRPTLLNIANGDILFVSDEYSINNTFRYSNGHLYILQGEEYIIYRVDVID
jgi:hypothetical protein